MINLRRLILATCLSCLLPWAIFADAPVVDESENFALNDQYAANEQSLARPHHQTNPYDDVDYGDEQPLARETPHASANGDNASLLNQVKSLQQEIQELRGQLEVQSHDLKVLQEQQLSYYKDLDARIRNPSATPPKTASAPTVSQQLPTTDVPPPKVSVSPKTPAIAEPAKVIPTAANSVRDSNPASEQIRYLAAFDLIKTKQHDKAVTAMQSFTNDYPNGGYTANAHYWLGELYMTKKDYPNAISHFDTVLKQFSSSNKSAPSLLKMGYALAASGKKQEAILRLKQVVKNYPDTNTAKLAKAKLISLNR